MISEHDLGWYSDPDSDGFPERRPVDEDAAYEQSRENLAEMEEEDL